MRVVVFIVICLAFTNSRAKQIQGSRHVDSLLESLEHEEWRRDEEQCKEATISLLRAVRNHTTWATWSKCISYIRQFTIIPEMSNVVWDSMQLPVAVLYGSRYHLGSFDQCLEDSWSQLPTQYCLVDVKLTEETRPNEEVDPHGSIKDFVGVETKLGRRLSFYSLGVCLPAVCSSSSIAKISDHIHKLSHLPFGDVSVDPRNCQVKERRQFSTGFYVFWLIIFLTTVIATTVYIVEDSITHPKLKSIANWFSPSKNFKALTKTNVDELSTLNGMRALSAMISVAMHYFLFVVQLATLNPAVIEKDIDTIIGRILIQGALVIDTFFVMSGLLLMKGLMTSSSNLVTMLCKRYIRLLPSFMLSLVCMAAVLPHAVSGPLWPKLKRQADTCVEFWWLGPMMINNFVRTDEMCYPITWYVACDYQLAILGTVIFWLCHKLRKWNVITFFMLTYLVSVMVPAVLAYWNELPAILIYDIDKTTEISSNRVFQTTYIKPHSRTSAYLIGMVLGYMMHVYKPKDYRKSIPKTWSILGGILGFVIIFSLMGLGGTINLRTYNAFQSSVYLALDKSIWAVAVCLQIIVCEYGTSPIIGDFFTSKVVVPLSRLSYGVYLYHPLLMYMNLYSTRSPMTYDFFHCLLNGSGYIVASYIVSYLLWFIIEAPMLNITNSLFKNRTRKAENQNGTTKQAETVSENGTKHTKIM